MTHLAQADVLEFTVVAADGRILRVSPHQHSDLFTALRGGGGAFAVVVSVAYRAHTPPSGFVGILGTYSMRADVEGAEEGWQNILRDFVALHPALSDQGPFSGYNYVVSGPSKSVCRGLVVLTQFCHSRGEPVQLLSSIFFPKITWNWLKHHSPL